MNKTTGITIVSILALLIIGGIIYNINKTPALPITAVDNTNTVVDTQTQAREVGAPVVVTKSNTVPTDTTAVLTGSVTPNGAFTNYWYEYGLTTGLGIGSKSQMLGSGFVNLNAPAYITGLTKNTQYYFRLVAENQYGKVAGQQYSFKTTDGVAAPVGSAPLIKTLAASSISRNAVNLNGEVTPNQSTTEYWFEYGKTANLGDTSASASIGNGSAKLSESVSISNLEAGTTYYFRINAQNQFGTVNGSILNFKTSGPLVLVVPSVTAQKAINVSTSSATLRALVNPNNVVTSYWFEYSTDSVFSTGATKITDNANLGADKNTTSVKADISDLSIDTTYYFRLVAKNSVGEVFGTALTFKTAKK